MSDRLLIAMMGLPRSGKSTVVAKLSQELGAPIVRRDAIRLALHGKRYEALAEPMIKAVSNLMIRSLFEAGHSVVICDETNVSKAARDYLKGDWLVRFYEVPTSVDICKERALLTGQEDLIPVIEAMAARYEPLGPEEQRYV